MIAKIVKALAFALLLAPFTATSQAQAKPIVEVGFVLDTTGSMGPLIEGAKRKIWSIATSIIETHPDAEIRMGLVAYRDIGDEYVTKVFPLTTDVQDLYARLLELKANGGGDWPESVNEALYTAVTKLSWTSGSDVRRIMFLVGDAPPHMDYVQDVKYPEVIRMARDRDIIVNAVQAGSARDTERVWREIAQLGTGRYIPIPQDGGAIVVIETPFDIEILELQDRINGTIIPYGPRPMRSSVEKKAKAARAAPAPVATEMAGYLNRFALASGGSESITGGGDLVADVAAGRQKLAAVKDEDLPETMLKLNPAERQAIIDKRLAERKELNVKLAALIKKRDLFVAEARKKDPKRVDSFDSVVADTLRMQLKR
jgi:hypothetical protein